MFDCKTILAMLLGEVIHACACRQVLRTEVKKESDNLEPSVQ